MYLTRVYLRNHTETLAGIPYADYPELKLNKNEATQMPFRYVMGGDGQPVMPEVLFLLEGPRDEKKAD